MIRVIIMKIIMRMGKEEVNHTEEVETMIEVEKGREKQGLVITTTFITATKAMAMN